MRIAIFSESYEPIVNGVSVCVGTLRDELTRRGHEVYVFAPAFKGHVDRCPNVFRLPSVHTFLMRDYPFPIPYSPAVREAFRSLKLDVVHTQTPFLLGILGARWARENRIPLVSTNHTLYTEYAHYVPVRPMALTRMALVRLMKWYYSGCDAVVVPSTPVEAILRSYGIRTRVEVIKTGVIPARLLSEEERRRFRAQLGLGEDELLLLYVGRIAREKNLCMLLDAFRIALQANPGLRLVLVGGGPALAETERRAQETGVGGAVRFTGMLPRSEIDPLYSAADLFVFPSKTETQGIAICEALSAGLPVVAVDAGGIPENIRHGEDGFLTADDPAEFADRILFLASHGDIRREMGARARTNSARFSVDRMIDDFERFYASVTAAAPAGVATRSVSR